MISYIKKIFSKKCCHNCIDDMDLQHIYRNPLQTKSDQNLYSEMVDLPDDYFKRLESLLQIAKETRVEKVKYLKDKDNAKIKEKCA